MNKVEQIIIASKARKNLDCNYIKESRFGLFICKSPRVIEMAEKLKPSDRIIQGCCGKF